MAYIHKEIKTNYGVLHAFCFGYDQQVADQPQPNVMLFYTGNNENVASSILFSKTSDGWVSEPYSKTIEKYHRTMSN